MNVLILGGSGMLGHKLCQVLSPHFDTYVTFRQSFERYAHNDLFDATRVVEHISAENFDSIVHAVAKVQPTVVINCIGIIKQLPLAKDPLTSISINALFPHRLARLCRAAKIRLIHFSTDCVFSGRRGHYTEDDIPDPVDLYGQTKLLGEVTESGCLTLRTSIIGRELKGKYGLLEWFISQQRKMVKGYSRAIYTGFTTHVFAELIGNIIENHPDLSGIWHVSSEPISKYELLCLINEAFKLDITIAQDETFFCDRSLDSRRFCEATGYQPPAWSEMIADMAHDSASYETYKE